MKKYRGIIFSAANFLVIVLIFSFIVLGLNKIGILELPDYVEKLFVKENENEPLVVQDDGQVYKSLIASDSATKTSQVISSLDIDNVRKLLENVKVYDNYYQEVVKTLYSGNMSCVVNGVIRRTDGLCEVSLYDNNNVLTSQIHEQIDKVTLVKVNADGSQTSRDIPKGDISIEQECGVIMTHKDFLDSGFVLDEGHYKLFDNEYGTVMEILFETNDGKYPQTQSYWLSLDYGVVIKAQCYENNELVYSLETKALTPNVG